MIAIIGRVYSRPLSIYIINITIAIVYHSALRLNAELHFRLVKPGCTGCVSTGTQGVAQAAGRVGPGREKHIGPADKLRLGRRRGGRDLSEAEQGFERPYGTSA